MAEELINNLIEEMGGAMPMTDNEDIGAGRKKRDTTESTKKYILQILLD